MGKRAIKAAVLFIVVLGWLWLPTNTAHAQDVQCIQYSDALYPGWTVELSSGVGSSVFGPYLQEVLFAGVNTVKISGHLPIVTGFSDAKPYSISYRTSTYGTEPAKQGFVGVISNGIRADGVTITTVNYTHLQSPVSILWFSDWYEPLNDRVNTLRDYTVQVQVYVEPNNHVALILDEFCYTRTFPTPTSAPSITPYPTSTGTATRTATPQTPTRTNTPITLTPTNSSTPEDTPVASSTASQTSFPTTVYDGFNTATAPDECGSFPLPPCGSLPFPVPEFPTLGISNPSAVPTYARVTATGVVFGTVTPQSYGTAVSDISAPVNGLLTPTFVGLAGAPLPSMETTANEVGTSIGGFFGLLRSMPFILYGRSWVLFVFLIMVIAFMFGFSLLVTALKLIGGVVKYIRTMI